MPDTPPQLGRLQRVDLREAWITEASDFTPWLAREENIRLLGETIGIELEVEAEEKNVGPFRADILCKNTADGTWVLIENQLERTDHTHLGQLLTYAAGLHAVTIVWIAARFTEEHRAALDWLNEITDEQVLFFALEVELWRIGDSQMAPKFNIVCSPNQWTRTVSEARKVIEQGTPSESKQRYIEFWTFFADRLNNSQRRIRAPRPSGDYWKTFSLGRSNFSLWAMVGARDEWIGVQVVLYGPRAKHRFRILEADKCEIERELGSAVEWRELPEYKESQIRIRKSAIDPKDVNNWPDICDWLFDWLEKFQAVFRPRIRSLDIDSDVDGEEA